MGVTEQGLLIGGSGQPPTRSKAVHLNDIRCKWALDRIQIISKNLTMYMSSIQLRNHASFADSGKIDLAPGFNLFVGPNNAGKSALLKAMIPPLQDNRHRGPDTAASTTPSELSFTLQTTVSEIADRLRAINQPLHFPAGSDRESQVGTQALSDFLSIRNRPVELQMSRLPGGAAHPQDGASIAMNSSKSGRLERRRSGAASPDTSTRGLH